MPLRRLAAAALLALAACSSGDDASAPTTTAAPAATTTTAPEAEAFTGAVDDFYVVPDPLPEAPPGTLIRTMDEGEEDGLRTVRIMYHSRDTQDRDRAVTGTVRFPTGEAPDGGWPVVSWAHGTSGLAAPCAPSRWGELGPDLGVGGVQVATDYIGLGPVGELHPYLSRPAEGHSVIDAVRAARNLPEAHAGPRWLAVGHSQGGHAAMAAHELGEEYAPELDLLGTVAFAPGAMFRESYGGIDDIVTRILTVMALYGAEGEYDEIVPDDYVTPEAAAAAEVIRTGCLPEITQGFLDLGFTTFFTHDPRTTEPAASLIDENDVGRVRVDAPLLLISGTDDQRVVLPRVQDLEERLCATGQVTETVIVDGATHDDIIGRTADHASAWLEARLAGEEAPDTCES